MLDFSIILEGSHWLMRALCLAALFLSVCSASSVGYAQSNVTRYNKMAVSNRSTLFNLTLSNDPYAVRLLALFSSSRLWLT